MEAKEIKNFTKKIRALTLKEMLNPKIIESLTDLDGSLKDLQQIMRKDKRYRSTVYVRSTDKIA